MVDCMALLKPDAMTGHWEFTYGAERVEGDRRQARLSVPRAATCATPNGTSRCSSRSAMFERGGVKIARDRPGVPYTPIANPRWMIPNWSFGIREDDVRGQRRQGARATARSWSCCSRTTASTSTASSPRASQGIDVILTGHTHDALPEAGQGRQDAAGRVRQPRQVRVAARPRRAATARCKDFRYKLIPLFADAIAPDPQMAATIAQARAPFAARACCARCRPHRVAALPPRQLQRHVRRPDLRRAARRARRRDRAVAGLPLGRDAAARAATSRVEDIYNATAITYPAAYRMTHDRRAAEGDARGRRRQPVQSRSLLPAGRRHGALRRARLHDRRRPSRSGSRISDLTHAARPASRSSRQRNTSSPAGRA